MNSLPSPSKRRLYSGLLAGALIVIAFVAAIALAGGLFKPLPDCTINDLKVVITPLGNSNVPTSQYTPIEGSYSGNLAGCAIWVLAHSASDGKYYPQATDDDPQAPGNCDKKVSVRLISSTESEGRWSTLFFATVADRLDLIVMVTNTDSQADRYFKGWVYDACKGHFRGGIPVDALPSPLTEMGAITIRTRQQ